MSNTTNEVAQFTPTGGKPFAVITMADLRFAVWMSTKSHSQIFVKDGAVTQDGKQVGCIEGSPTGE